MKDQIIALINSDAVDSFRYFGDIGEIVTVRKNETTRFLQGKGNFSRSERQPDWTPAEWMISFLPYQIKGTGFKLFFL